MASKDELAAADLGDPRRVARLIRVAERLESDPTRSIAAAMNSSAEREAAYRLLNNEGVDFGSILAPHAACTAERAAQAGRVVVAHDTTEFGFSTPREGLGRINDAELGRGFFMHTALAVSRDGRREPLGVLGAKYHMRMKAPGKSRKRHTERVKEAKKESARWWSLVEEVAQRLDDPSRAVHVMDREADNYVLLARMRHAEHNFVIRARHDRRIELEGMKEPTLKHELSRLEGRVLRTVTLSPRDPKPLAQPMLPPNRSRNAMLEFRATPVVLCRPKPSPETSFDLPETLELNLVHVVETDPPEGYDPIEWKLYTSEPIETAAQIEDIVDLYDTRWVIEEYFKALKTGCAVEKRELESARSILNCIAILIPIAWSTLRIRTLARNAGDEPATAVASKLQIKVLQRIDFVRMREDNPTVRDVYLAIATLGRHIKSNGPPGWQVLIRGYKELLTLTRGAAAMAGLEIDDYL